MSTTYTGKLLRVNLSTGDIRSEKLDLELAKKFIGGRGLGTKILMDEIDPKVDPFSPKNKIVIMAGALTGAQVPTGGRFMVITKSPLTGMIACSNSGGEWGAQLRYNGYDGIIVEGESQDPEYLIIDGEEVKVKSAHSLWGKTTSETVKYLKSHEGKDITVLNIGPAGENGSPLAAIINDEERAAGRSGVGAVMGVKNLKAIVLKNHRSNIVPFDQEAMRQEAITAVKKIKEDSVTGEGLPKYGTAVLINIINQVGCFPTENWQGSYSEKAKNISGELMAEKDLTKTYHCHGCPIGCGRVVLRNGKEIGGPEYEPLWAYGGGCGVTDLKSIYEANYWCNELGLDAISTPATIASAMELYQKGIISEKECEGIPLLFGNKAAIVEWTRRMGYERTNLGYLMAQGSYRLCKAYGHPEYSMTVKKQELPAYDPRGIQGIGITYATSNRGGCHVRGYMISPEILGHPKTLDRTSIEGKAQWAKIFQDLTAVIDSMGMCLFTSFALNAEDYATFLNAGIGTDYDVSKLLEVGERIYNLERLFNQRAGMNPEEDTLPKRILETPIADGPSKGETSHLKDVLPEYYRLRGWENAFPTHETLERLGL